MEKIRNSNIQHYHQSASWLQLFSAWTESIEFRCWTIITILLLCVKSSYKWTAGIISRCRTPPTLCWAGRRDCHGRHVQDCPVTISSRDFRFIPPSLLHKEGFNWKIKWVAEFLPTAPFPSYLKPVGFWSVIILWQRILPGQEVEYFVHLKRLETKL